MKRTVAAVVAAILFSPAGAEAVTSTRSVPSAMGGNGHNVTFDGRVLIVRRGAGWEAQLIRPEAITYLTDGLPDPMGPLLSPFVPILDDDQASNLNALAICEDAPAPYACDASGAPAAGPYDCYEVWIIDADAVTPVESGGFIMRRRSLKLWVENPRSAGAAIHRAEFGAAAPLSPALLGIEPTITKDGRLLVWQGHPANDGRIDTLIYSTNAGACAASGWSTPRSITHMFGDPAVQGRYPIGDRALRAADGSPFADGDLFYGAYPWIFPDGSAINFTATPLPCRGPEDPPGCGPRRGAFSVVGYPTNWAVAHVDGGVNPDTNQTVRLFFSSPGPTNFTALPISAGNDVWPFFGSNTSNYVELVFDDGLDGQYAAMWHFNEMVTKGSASVGADLDVTRTPDVSGYFNTGQLMGGLGFSPVNDGVVGKALVFDGFDDRVEVPSSASLSPVNGLTIDFWIRPDADPNCDDGNNYRYLLGKGGIGEGEYTIVLEESRQLQARVRPDGAELGIWTPALPVGVWTHVSIEWDGTSGRMTAFYDGAEVAVSEGTPFGTLIATSHPVMIGGPGQRSACPAFGDGSFLGALDEVSISRVARRTGTGAPNPDGGPGSPDGPSGPGPGMDGGGGAGGGAAPAAQGDGGGCGCRAASRRGPGGALLLLAFLLYSLRGPKGGAGRSSPRARASRRAARAASSSS